MTSVQTNTECIPTPEMNSGTYAVIPNATGAAILGEGGEAILDEGGGGLISEAH